MSLKNVVCRRQFLLTAAGTITTVLTPGSIFGKANSLRIKPDFSNRPNLMPLLSIGDFANTLVSDLLKTNLENFCLIHDVTELPKVAINHAESTYIEEILPTNSLYKAPGFILADLFSTQDLFHVLAAVELFQNIGYSATVIIIGNSKYLNTSFRKKMLKAIIVGKCNSYYRCDGSVSSVMNFLRPINDCLIREKSLIMLDAEDISMAMENGDEIHLAMGNGFGARAAEDAASDALDKIKRKGIREFSMIYVVFEVNKNISLHHIDSALNPILH